MVGRLIDDGNAYVAHGTVYFDVSTFPSYGKVSHYSRRARWCASRASVAATPTTRTAVTPSTSCSGSRRSPDEPAWQAPFGVGRPGWHIECSVMAMHELGPTLDLHGGGTDLIFPHHECEVAQSESITGEPFSRHWVHSAMVSYEGEKMSKSLGNLVFVSDLLKTADPRAIRLALMQHHYRAGFEWHDTDLDDGTALLHRLLAAAERPDGADPRPYAERVRAAIDDDLDTPRALDGARRPRRARCSPVASDTTAPAVLRELGALLGVDLDRAAPHASVDLARCRGNDLSRRAQTSLSQRRQRPMRAITITLPDGSTREHDSGVTAGEIAASIGAGLAKAALAAQRATASGSTSTVPIDHDAQVAIITPDVRRRPRGAAPLDRARDGPGGQRPVPGAEVRHRPRHRRRLLLRLRAAGRPALLRRRPRAHRGRMREIVKADEPFVREELDREHAIATFAEQPYKVEIIEQRRPRGLRRDR